MCAPTGSGWRRRPFWRDCFNLPSALNSPNLATPNPPIPPTPLSSPDLCAALPLPGSTDLRYSINTIPSNHNTHEYSIIDYYEISKIFLHWHYSTTMQMNLNMLLSMQNTLLNYAHLHIHCVLLAPSKNSFTHVGALREVWWVSTFLAFSKRNYESMWEPNFNDCDHAT